MYSHDRKVARLPRATRGKRWACSESSTDPCALYFRPVTLTHSASVFLRICRAVPTMVASRSLHGSGGNEDHPCRAEPDRKATCFNIASRGTRRHRPTVVFGLMCREKTASVKPSRSASVVHQVSPKQSSVSTSNPRESTASKHSGQPHRRRQPSANRQKSGFRQQRRGGGSRSNPLPFSPGSTRSISG